MEKFIKEITKKAGKLTFKKFGKIGVKYTKRNVMDVVTEADLISNRFLLKSIKRKFPDHGIISEETGEYKTNAEYVWIVDPLDGTMNFSKKIPLYCVLVALKRKDKLEMACIYNPIMDELYFAKRGKGAYLNGKRIYCTDQKTLADSFGCQSNRMGSEQIQVFNKIFNYLQGQRCWVGSYACIGLSGAFVASGKKDWFISTGTGHLWDYAAPYLVNKEAGCKVTNLEGKEWSFSDNQMIVSNPKLHAEIMKVIKD